MKARKVGFLVEGDRARGGLEPIVRRLLPADVRSHFVRMGGKIGLLSSWPTVLLLKSKGYEHVFVLFDAESDSPRTIERMRFDILDMLRSHEVDDGVSVLPVAPTLEGWLGISAAPNPRRWEPEEDTTIYRERAEALDLDALAASNPSFADFVAELRRVVAGGADDGHPARRTAASRRAQG